MSDEQRASFPPVGGSAPHFELPSIQGETISLVNYRDRSNVILWFSRGFTCHFCRGFMQDIIDGYEALQANDTVVIQVAPNLHATARGYFADGMPPFPFVCDPDKRLYAIYGLGDRGALRATVNTLVTFSTAFTRGEGLETVRASWQDVANRNFVRRLHHHALTAMEQGVFIIDKGGIVRYKEMMGAVEAIPPAETLLDLTQRLCT